MSRPKSDVTISCKGQDGQTWRLNLTRMIDGRWLVYRDGAKSQKHPYATSTEISNLLRTWLAKQ